MPDDSLPSLRRSRHSHALVLALGASIAVTAAACGDDDSGNNPLDPNNADGGPDGDGPNGPQPTRLSRPSRGSAIAISEDDTIVVAANRDAGSVSVFDVAYPAGAPPTVTKKADIAVCKQPYQVVLAPNGDRGFVVCREDQKVVRIEALRSAPVKGPEAKVGSEPTGIALTPKATAAWVANWMDGTLMEVDTEAMTVKSTVDLNAALVGTGVLGTVNARAALAHPRSLAITNNRDDVENDESIFVTEFFGQTKEELAADASNADVAKQGFVYRVSVRDKVVKPIALPPIPNIGIPDHTGGTVGCYPNLLQAIDIQGSFAYVASICASPKGPLGEFLGPAFLTCAVNGDADCKGTAEGRCSAGVCTTNCDADDQCGLGGKCTNFKCEENYWDTKALQTPAITVIDIGGDKVVASVALNGEWDAFYKAKNVPDTTARRMPLHVGDIGFVPGTLTAYLPAKGADAVYRVDFNASYDTKAVDSIGSGDRGFIPLDVATLDAAKQGKVPIGIAVAHAAKVDSPNRYAFVLNEATRNVTVLDLKADAIAGLPDNAAVAAAAPMPGDATGRAILEGKRLFETGLGRWSLNGQAWGACSTCHWEGLSDQVTWFHNRGPRQSPSVDATINKKNTNDIRAMNWQASSDELADNENGALRSTLGGIGAVVKSHELAIGARIAIGTFGNTGLNGSINAAADPASPSSLVGEVCVLDDWKVIDMYEKTMRSPKRPTNLDAAKVTAGRAAFEEGKCQGCHGGDKWTLSRVFYSPTANKDNPGATVNAQLRSLSWKDTVEGATGFPLDILPVATTSPLATMRYNGMNASSWDSLTCLLRNVGTFGLTEPGVGVVELRRNMTAKAQGDGSTAGAGYNVPSLTSTAVSAPYLHAGQARTLEAVLSPPFEAHYQAINKSFLTGGDAAAKRAALVEFLLSIDEDTPKVALPALGPDGGDFCRTP